MRSSTGAADSRADSCAFPRLAPACLLLALVVLLGACDSAATVTVGANGQPTATASATTAPGQPTATSGSGLQPTATPGSGGPTATPTHTPVVGPPPSPTYFVWTASSGNSVDDYTIIDNPNTNGNPNAILIVTPRWPPNDVYDNHAIGVWYASGHWTIFHQDQTGIQAGAAYDVKVYSVGSGVFRWSAASSTLNGNLTYITNSLIPAGASAKLLVTPVYDANDVYDNYPIGTWWSGSSWTVFNQKASIAASAPMPANAAFNVVSVAGSGVFTQVASGSNSAGDYTVISGNSATDGRPNAVLVCSPRWDTSTSVYDNHNIGVYYTGGHWAIFNQDLTGIPNNATFNCAAYGG